MKKILFLLSITFLLNGCVESIALIGNSVGGASSGKLLQTSLNSTFSYGIKKTTGKTPLGHALAYAEKKNPEKKKENCLTFITKTKSEFCTAVKNQISFTNAAVKKKVLKIEKKYIKTKDFIGLKNVAQSKDVATQQEKNFINSFFKSNSSPRKLAIALQTKIKKAYKDKDLNQPLFRR